MILQIPKEESFLCPEGIFQAAIIDVRPYSKKVNEELKTFIRIVWQVHRGIEYGTTKAGKNYSPSLESGSELREDLSALGITLPPGGQLDTDLLIGLQCDLQIGHIYNEGHDKPFVHVKKVARLGALAGE